MDMLQRTSSSRPAKSGRLTVTGVSAAGLPPPSGGAFSLVGAALRPESIPVGFEPVSFRALLQTCCSYASPSNVPAPECTCSSRRRANEPLDIELRCT